MADPFTAYHDLIWGLSNPYTDDDPAVPGNAAQQDQSATYFDPSQAQPANVGILGRIAPPGASAQDQSAAFLDPSALQPPLDLTAFAPPPPGAAQFTMPNGDAFWIPKGTSFNDVYQAGQGIRNKPMTHQLTAIDNDLGHKGTFDFQRQGGTFNGNYKDASNFAVGVYMNGAGYSWPEIKAIGDIYAFTHDPNGLPAGDEDVWRAGYDAANNGKLP